MNRALATILSTGLGVGALAMAAASAAAQLGFAIIGVGVVGMAHGAGDLAVVSRSQRVAFLSCYGLVSLATLLWWTADPAVALPMFLAASAMHFGLEDAPDGATLERAARGIALVAAPAALHGEAYADLLRTAGGASSILADSTLWLGLGGAAAGMILLIMAWRRRDYRLATGTAALLLLPPLVGFTFGFLILHALPQTLERRDRLGYATSLAYLRGVAPIFVAAVLLAGGVAAMLLKFDPSGVRGLFAGIAALAVPHLLVTPWFEGREAVGRPARFALGHALPD